MTNDFSCSTRYSFVHKNSEITILDTTDVREISKVVSKNWIEVKRPVIIDGKNYIVDHIVIEPINTNGNSEIYVRDLGISYQKGKAYDWNISLRIFLIDSLE